MKIYNKDKIVSIKVYDREVCSYIKYRDELRVLWGKILLREEGYYDYRINSRKIDVDKFEKNYYDYDGTIYKKARVVIYFSNDESLTETFLSFYSAKEYAHTLIEEKDKIIVNEWKSE